MLVRFLEDSRIRLAERLLQGAQRRLLLTSLQIGETLEGIEHEILNRGHAEAAGNFAGLASSDAVGDQHHIAAMGAEARPELT